MKISKLLAMYNDFTVVGILIGVLSLIDIMILEKTLTASRDGVGKGLLSSPAKEIFNWESLKGKN